MQNLVKKLFETKTISSVFLRNKSGRGRFFEFKGEVFSLNWENQRDPIYISRESPNYDPRALKFVNHITKNGEKFKAYTTFKKTLNELDQIIQNELKNIPEEHKDPKEFFFTALAKLKPIIEVRKIKVLGYERKVPFTLSHQRARFFATKILLSSIFQPYEQIDPAKLAREVVNAYFEKGPSYAKKVMMHKEVEGCK